MVAPFIMVRKSDQTLADEQREVAKRRANTSICGDLVPAAAPAEPSAAEVWANTLLSAARNGRSHAYAYAWAADVVNGSESIVPFELRPQVLTILYKRLFRVDLDAQ